MQIIGFLLFAAWLYIIVESFICFWRMHHGDRLCRILKYLMASIVPCVGVGLYIFGAQKIITTLWLIPDLAIALFFWPSTYARFTGGFKNRIGDK